MKKLILILGLLLLFPQLAIAQSNRNPCIYLNTSNNNCQPVGTSTNGVGNSPMPVGGLATVAAPTFVEGMMGGLSFDLSGNLRVIPSGSSGGGAVTIADGADVTQGAIADIASTAGGAGTVSSKLRLVTTQLGTINTTLGSPFQAGGSLAANQSVNISQINGATPLMGNGVTGTGSQRVTIASDNTPFPVNATLSAETTKVIGTVNQGTSPWVINGAVTNTTAAGENHIGEVGGNIIPITNSMTTSNATVTTGQSIGGIQTLANAVRVSGSLGASGTSGIIQSVVLTFSDAIGSGPLDIYFYNATVTTGSNCANATTFVLQTADRLNVLGIAHVTDFTSSNTAVMAQAGNLAIPFGLASSTNLFACVVARAGFAITGTSNASLKVNVLRN